MVRLIAFTLFLFLSCVQLAASQEKKDAFFETFDVLALPGEFVKLRFRLFDNTKTFPYFNQLFNEKVELYKGTKLVDVPMSKDSDGTFFFEVKVPENEGILTYFVKIARNSSFKADGSLTVSVVRRCSPILISDIDHTIADISTLRYLFVDYKDMATLEGSQEVLSRFASRISIVYLTARNEIFMEDTRKWLEFNKYVKGPVFFWSFTHHPFYSDEYKTSVIKQLRRKHPNIIVGIGDKLSDVKAYLSNGLRAYHISEDIEVGEKKNVLRVSSWIEIEKHLNANPFDEKDLYRHCGE